MNPNWFTDIPGYGPTYKVARTGTVISLNYQRTGKCKKLKPVKDKDGYQIVILCKNGKIKAFKVHRLVGLVFLPNPNRLPEINHEDGNKCNNRVGNLEWCTRRHNSIHALITGLRPYTTEKQRAATKISGAKRRKTVYQYTLDKKLINSHEGLGIAAQATGANPANISAVCLGKVKTAAGFSWSYVKL